DRARAALNQTDIQTSLLYFPSAFQPSSAASIRQLTTDFEQLNMDREITGFGAFTTRDMLHFLLNSYYTDLAGELEAGLRAAGTRASARGSEDLWLAGNAIRRTEQRRERPRRHI